jgi:hypothetical protein
VTEIVFLSRRLGIYQGHDSSRRMKHAQHDDASEYTSNDTRGAHLKLAQRHHKIVAGQFHGRTKIEPELAHPGVVGQLAVCFTPSATLPRESRITCVLPDHGWNFPHAAAINAVLRLPQGYPVSSLKTTFTAVTRTLEITILTEEIPSGTFTVILISGVSTPEAATPAGEATVTSYEKLVVRNTAPVSTRGGRILDGPTAFTIPAIVPGELSGAKTWQPFSCCPSAVSDVSLSFVTHGCVQNGGKILIELPADGWDMHESPRVLLRTKEYHNDLLCAHWRRDDHALEIELGDHLLHQDTRVILSIGSVKNPPKETMNLRESSANSARVTTLVASGGVVDGPTPIEVARISELRESDFEVAKQAYDEVSTAGACAFVPLDKLSDVLHRTGIVLSPDLYKSLVTVNLPVRIAEDSTPVDSNGEPKTDSIATPHANEITREEFLNLFAQLYAPAYKFGQELRLACGRGEVDRIRELILRGCDANAKDGAGWAALHYAADYGHLHSIDTIVETMDELTTQGSHIKSASELEINIRDLHGWTPLLCAAANGHTEIVEKLLALGGDLLIASTEGRTALHWAALRGMDKTVLALLAADAEKDRTDECGWTPLHCASLHGSDACVKLLVEHGANKSIQDKLHYPPATYAAGLAATEEALSTQVVEVS